MKNNIIALLGVLFHSSLIAQVPQQAPNWGWPVNTNASPSHRGNIAGTPGEYRTPYTSGTCPNGAPETDIFFNNGGYCVPRGQHRFHQGVDITASNGSLAVYSIEPQNDTIIQQGTGYNSRFLINGWIYWHTLNTLNVTPSNRRVNPNQHLGNMDAGAAHIHFQQLVDPNNPNLGLNSNMLTMADRLPRFTDDCMPIRNGESDIIREYAFYKDSIKLTSTVAADIFAVNNNGIDSTRKLYGKVDIMVRTQDQQTAHTGVCNGGNVAVNMVGFNLYSGEQTDEDPDSLVGSLTDDIAWINFTDLPKNAASIYTFAQGTTLSDPRFIATAHTRETPYNRYFNTRLKRDTVDNWLYSPALEARNNDEAEYTDGLYTFKLFAGDVDQDADHNWDNELVAVVFDNFAPFVHTLSVVSDFNNRTYLLNQGQALQNGNMDLAQVTNTIIDPDHNIRIYAYASEKLIPNTVRLRMAGSAQVWGPSNITTTDSLNFEFRIPMSDQNVVRLPQTLPNETFDYVCLSLEGEDLAGNQLRNLGGAFQNNVWAIPDSGFVVPKRNRAGAFTPATIPTGRETIHCFRTLCQRDGMRGNGCLAVDFDHVVVGHRVDFTEIVIEGTPTSLHWDFGDGNSANGSTPVHTYTSSGVYQVKLTAYDSNGDMNFAIHSVTIANCTPPALTFSVINIDRSPGSGHTIGGRDRSQDEILAFDQIDADIAVEDINENDRIVLSIDNLNGNDNYDITWVDAAGNPADPLAAAEPGMAYTMTFTNRETGCQWQYTVIAGNGLDVPSCIPDVELAIRGTWGDGNDCGAVATISTGNMQNPSYLWNEGGTDVDRHGMVAGNYQLTVTDQGGCSFSGDLTIPLLKPSVRTYNSCGNSCNGGVSDMMVENATNTDNIGFVWPDGSEALERFGLCADYQYILIRQHNAYMPDCYYLYGFAIDSFPGMHVNYASNSTCNPSTGGGAYVQVSAGTAPYSYLWSDGAEGTEWFSGFNFRMNLPNGTYTASVTDANGCVAGTGEMVIQPIDFRVYYMPGSSGQSFCGNVRNIPAPTISETPRSQNPNYTYRWSNGAVTPSLQNMPPGTYGVTVTSPSGCTASTSYTWYRNTNIMPVNLNLLGKPCYQWTQSMHSIVDTFDFSTYGYLEVTANGFNNQGESYRWTCPNTGSPSSGQGVLNGNYLRVPSGNFSITVTSSSGCETIKQMYIPKGFINDVTPLVFDACSNTTLGQINFSNLSHMNASPSRPVYSGFDYEWYDQGGNSIYANRFPSNTIFPPPGTYTVVSRDINSDCVSSSRNYTVNATPLEIAGNRVRGNTCFDEIPWATRDGLDGLGAALYTYSFTPNDRGLHGETWTRNGSSIPSLGIGAITRDRYPIDPGHYCMTLQDVRGCIAQDCFTVNDGEYGTNVSCPYTYHYCDFGNGTNFLGTTQTGNPVLQTDPLTCNAWYQCGDVRGTIYYGSPSSATNGVAINQGRSGVWFIPYSGGFWRDAQHGNTISFSLTDLPSCRESYDCIIEEGINHVFPGHRGPPIQTYDTLDQSLSDRCNYAGRQVNIYCQGNWIGYYCIAQPRLAPPTTNTPDGFSIYPNPFDKHIVVEFGNDKPIRYRIMDIVGTSITDKGFRLQGNEGKAFIHDLEGYPPGSYILDITFESGNQVSSLIIKQ